MLCLQHVGKVIQVTPSVSSRLFARSLRRPMRLSTTNKRRSPPTEGFLVLSRAVVRLSRLGAATAGCPTAASAASAAPAPARAPAT